MSCDFNLKIKKEDLLNKILLFTMALIGESKKEGKRNLQPRGKVLAYIYIHTCTHIHTCIHIYVYIYVCIYMYVYVYIYVYIYTHIYI